MDPLPLLILSLVLSIPITLATNLATPAVSRRFARFADWWSARRASEAWENRNVAIYYARYQEAWTQALIFRALRIGSLLAVATMAAVAAGSWPSGVPGPGQVPMLVAFFTILGVAFGMMFETYAQRRRVQEAWHQLKDIEEGITPLGEAPADLAEVLRNVAANRRNLDNGGERPAGVADAETTG